MDFIATIIFFVVLFSILKIVLVQDCKHYSKNQVLRGELSEKDTIRSCNEHDLGCGLQGKLIDGNEKIETSNKRKIDEIETFENEKIESCKNEKVETFENEKIESRENEKVETCKNEKAESCSCQGDHEIGEQEGGLVDEEDDWEGIESTELERRFGAAVALVGSKTKADMISRLSGDLKLQLYALHKIAIEGPCNVPQPTAFKVSARAKWNAWQQLGDMPREVAMQQYVNILSTNGLGASSLCRDP
ncbi:hypothetical protein K2173_002600 [Erythroxylum novogranatense]|uniref:ACB domain-containing protein n=1 Tax=Erythroxylum novogranatense TaxID=1862640 RepID=A0AAV8TSE0_9ROSI|nr:hypothetical protein K2173_002600 [Erythroxylum novogranatense]